MEAIAFVKALATERRYFWHVAFLLLLGELVVNFAIVQRVPYTEIDWKAYMEEVAGVVEDGELDYTKLKGGTGPLVYPAGFVYVFTLFYWATARGLNIRLAQYLFIGVYEAVLVAVFVVLHRTRKMPPWSLALLCLSYRVHSLFALRLFNDTVAMLFLYIAVVLFVNRRWSLGCLWFSLAVSVKMNILLFAPGLLLLLLQSFGVWGTIPKLAICAIVQVVLGAPFLAAHPVSYLARAFELTRVFFFKWTVNWRFLGEELFLDKRFALLLLGGHLVVLGLFWAKWVAADGGFVAAISSRFRTAPRLTAEYIVTVLFVSNFVGIAFARTLHYQFYSWYFHALPLLAWQTPLPVPLRLAVMAGIEYAFNVYPSTNASSAVLQVCHFVLLGALLVAQVPAPRIPRDKAATEAREAKKAR